MSVGTRASPVKRERSFGRAVRSETNPSVARQPTEYRGINSLRSLCNTSSLFIDTPSDHYSFVTISLSMAASVSTFLNLEVGLVDLDQVSFSSVSPSTFNLEVTYKNGSRQMLQCTSYQQAVDLNKLLLEGLHAMAANRLKAKQELEVLKARCRIVQGMDAATLGKMDPEKLVADLFEGLSVPTIGLKETLASMLK